MSYNTNNQSNVLAVMRSKIPLSASGIPRDMTLSEFSAYWLQYLTPDLKAATRYSYQSAFANHINRVFTSMKLSDISSEDVQLFILSLVEGIELPKPLSPKTIRNIHGVLHKCLQTAYELKIIDENPAKHNALPKLMKPELIPMNNEQVIAFLSAIAEHPLEAIYKLALFTGMRISELIGLTWDCFNFDEGSIRIYRQLSYDKFKRAYTFATVKNDKPRIIYPAKAVIKMMKRLHDDEPNNSFVFCGLGDSPYLTYSMVRRPFEKIMKQIGMPEFRFHDLRHTYAVISIKAGVDLKILSAAMGHHSVAFTLDTYAFALTDMKLESAKRMQSFLNEQKIKV